MKTIAIGADDAAYAFRDAIVAYLNGQGIKVADYTTTAKIHQTLTIVVFSRTTRVGFHLANHLTHHFQS